MTLANFMEKSSKNVPIDRLYIEVQSLKLIFNLNLDLIYNIYNK